MNRFFLVLFKVPPPFQDTIKYGLGHTCKSLPIIITTLSFSCHLLIAFPIEVPLVAYTFIRSRIRVSLYHCIIVSFSVVLTAFILTNCKWFKVEDCTMKAVPCIWPVDCRWSVVLPR